MSLASVALEALSLAAPRIPDKVFDMIPGGYYKSADEAGHGDRKQTTKSSRKKGPSHHDYHAKRRGRSEDGRRSRYHRTPHSSRLYESDWDYSATDDHTDEEELPGTLPRSSGRRPAHHWARSVDTRHGSSSSRQRPRSGRYSPEYRHQTIAGAQQNGYGPYSSTNYSPHRQGYLSPARSHRLPESVATGQPPYPGAAQSLTGPTATPYIPYSDIYGVGGEHRRAPHDTLPSGSSTPYSTSTPSRRRSSMPPTSYEGSYRRRSIDPSPAVGGYPYAAGASVPPSIDTPPRSIDRYRPRRNHDPPAEQLGHFHLEGRPRPRVTTTGMPTGAAARDESQWSAPGMSRGDVWEREVGDGVRSRSGVRQRDRSRHDSSDLEMGNPDSNDNGRGRGRRRRKVRLQVDGDDSDDDS